MEPESRVDRASSIHPYLKRWFSRTRVHVYARLCGVMARAVSVIHQIQYGKYGCMEEPAPARGFRPYLLPHLGEVWK